jgi:hypothetical protein
MSSSLCAPGRPCKGISTAGALSDRSVRCFPNAAPELYVNLLIMWKTQDSCGFRLWITRRPALLHPMPSGRIGDAIRGPLMAARTLKTPAQRASVQSASSGALVVTSGSSTGFRPWRGHRRPFSTKNPDGTPSERQTGVRYTPYLAFRLRRLAYGTAAFPQMWKDVLITYSSRSSGAISDSGDARDRNHGYASEQVLDARRRSRRLWMIEGAPRSGVSEKGKRGTALRSRG